MVLEGQNGKMIDEYPHRAHKLSGDSQYEKKTISQARCNRSGNWASIELVSRNWEAG
jgi:hypothetical protein